MGRRLNLDFNQSNKYMLDMYNKLIKSETNDEKLKCAKKALKKVIEEQLSARQKEMIVLYYYKQMDMTEISKLLNVNVSTVSRTINRAKNNIFKYMQYYF